MTRYAPEVLTAFCTDVLVASGVRQPVAATVAASLIYADVRGVDSHGVLRLPIYVRRVREGMVDVEREPGIIEDRGATALLDGGNNFGAYVGQKALDLAIERARRHGVATIAVRRSNHFGTAAYFAEQAAAGGLIAVIVSNASQTMPPTGGVRPFLGTNPLAIAAPSGGVSPFLLDMATSQVARGKIIAAARRGEPIPEGWAIDAAGQPTRDAEAGLAGAVLPLGGAKGYGLSMAIDILAGVLTGAGYGPYVRNMYEDWDNPQDVGHAFILIDIAAFMPLSSFVARMREYLGLLKTEPRAPGVAEILFAGEYEHRLAEGTRESGIALSPALVQELAVLAKDLAVAPPVPIVTPLDLRGAAAAGS
ncbi:Ldh family oxidoreductase [Phreatobacter sp.]|uniref:Ldh family oxidoreductase n=1 Tax=Phreatobacter sp. TaxID=1966341 RepID=UPI0022CC05C2|nr:Ldh family oxidoreductase [Phreatobacter sp.]MCZ8315717.1 Ldh family oxidoreductase [Phreatobacter sp.]